MNKKISIILFSTVLFTLSSCKKDGTGGKANIIAFPKHHAHRIKGATVYVKFGAEDLPKNPTSDYDLKAVGNPAEEFIKIEGLRYGHYYLYASGYDSTIFSQVQGGVAMQIKWGQRKNDTNADIPVTEP